MKKFLILFVIFYAVNVASQQEVSNKLDWFAQVDANIGLDLPAMIKNRQTKNDAERQQLPPGKFNYGFSAQVGYQPFNRLALATGMRYSFVDPNYHVLFWNVQPYVFLGDPKDEDFNYLTVYYGKQINRTASANGHLIGLGLGKIEPINQHLGHKIQLYVESQLLDDDGAIFVGLSYGITFFSNKNL